jgi:DNA-binding NarL/FixJ family response regulator
LEKIGARGEALRAASLVREIASTESPDDAGHLPYPGLTRRETEILNLVAGGLTNPEIAEKLFLSIRTVERHISSIYQKIGAEGKAARAMATAFALEHAPQHPG